jgi:hypothetical protein
MATWKYHADQKGFQKMNKKWMNMGKHKPTLAENAKKTKIPDKRLKIKA